MSLKAWVYSHRPVLRRLLEVAVLWRIAVRLILKYETEHDDSPLCLLCAAKLRALKYAHTPGLGFDRQVFCRKCGLPFTKWNSVPKCSNKRPPSPPAVKSSKVNAVPINW